MAHKLAALTGAFFDSIGLKYDYKGDQNQVIDTGMGGLDNLPGVRMVFIFDIEGNGVQACIPALLSVPADKVDNMYRTINAANSKYRWVKFYIDEERDIRVEVDALLDQDSCGEECLGLFQRLAHIADDAYPMFMKEIWK